MVGRTAHRGCRSFANVESGSPLGLKSDGGSGYHKVRSTAATLGLDTSHFLGRSWSKGTGAGRDAAKQREAARRWYNDNKQVYLDRNHRRQ
jgi:hypothetical protein